MNSGFFGIYGGQFVSETLMPALAELSEAFLKIASTENFKKEYEALAQNYVGRPTPLSFAKNLSEYFGGIRIFLKREDLCHTGAHKINNTLGQILLAKKMGKQRIIAETGAGQHGVATATIGALMKIPCEVYMGSEDMQRQAINVQKMRLLGAKIHPVNSGTKTLKDAMNEALRDWVTNVSNTFYCIGSAAGPHPYPTMVREFQSIIGQELIYQLRNIYSIQYPDYLLACVGGGSNAIGFFHPFVKNKKVKFIGVEAGGRSTKNGEHAATLARGKVGVLHGSRSYILQNEDGQITATHSISAGLDYPGVGPEHAFYKDQKRATYVSVSDAQALKGVKLLSRLEGIIPALESAHAVAYLEKLCKKIPKKSVVIVNISGRGDKDMATIMGAS